MVTARSLFTGTLYAAAGISIGILFDSYMSQAVQGSMPYLNDAARTMGNIGEVAGIFGGLGIGIYEAFLSPNANPARNPPAPPVNPNMPNAGPRININVRGGRNRFRL